MRRNSCPVSYIVKESSNDINPLQGVQILRLFNHLDQLIEVHVLVVKSLHQHLIPLEIFFPELGDGCVRPAAEEVVDIASGLLFEVDLRLSSPPLSVEVVELLLVELFDEELRGLFLGSAFLIAPICLFEILPR